MIDIEKYARGVIGSAEEEAAKIKAQADAERQSALQKTEDLLLEKYFHDMQARVLRLRGETRRRVSELSRQSMKEVFDHRNAVVNNIFDEAFSKVSEFRKTDEYRELLMKQAEFCRSRNEVKAFYVSDQDLELVSGITGGTEVRKDSSIRLGGLRAWLADETVVDLTIDGKAAEVREKFVRESGLRLTD